MFSCSSSYIVSTTHLTFGLIEMILDVHLICSAKDPNSFHISHLQYTSEDTYGVSWSLDTGPVHEKRKSPKALLVWGRMAGGSGGSFCRRGRAGYCHTQGHLAILRLASSPNPSPRYTTTTDFFFWQAFKNGSTVFGVFETCCNRKTSEGKIRLHLSKQPTLWHGSWASTYHIHKQNTFIV